MAKRTAIKNAARRMPPLYHKIPGEVFDIRKARTIWLLCKQPEILNSIWNEIKQSGSIIYNTKTGKWRGIDFVAEDDENEN